MLVYSTINIGGDSGIKCAVFAFEDIEEIHKLTITEEGSTWIVERGTLNTETQIFPSLKILKQVQDDTI